MSSRCHVHIVGCVFSQSRVFVPRFAAEDPRRGCSSCFLTFLFTPRKVVRRIKSKGKKEKHCTRTTAFTFAVYTSWVCQHVWAVLFSSNRPKFVKFISESYFSLLVEFTVSYNGDAVVYIWISVNLSSSTSKPALESFWTLRFNYWQSDNNTTKQCDSDSCYIWEKKDRFVVPCDSNKCNTSFPS